MKKKFLVVSILASLLGTVIAGISTSQHMRIAREGLEKESFCAISETVNCDIINASSYSEFLDVPTAWWGLVYYVVTILMAIFCLFSKKDPRATMTAAWIMALESVVVSAYLAYITISVLGVVCIECVGMYIVNLALVVLLYLAIGNPVSGIFRFARDYVRTVFGKTSNLGFKPRAFAHFIVITLMFLVGWTAFAAVKANSKSAGKSAVPIDNISAEEKLKAFYMQSLYAIEPDPNWPVWGNPNAPVTIIEFSEFQCPFCKNAAFNLRPYLQQFKKDVRFYFVNYPLDQSCNDEVTHPIHQFACMAASAAVCAKERGDFWGYHDELFRNQQKLGPDTFISIAKKHGWDEKEFQACMDSPGTLALVKADIRNGAKAYVEGTPTVIVNNRRLKYWMDPKFLQAVVKEEIKRSKTKK